MFRRLQEFIAPLFPFDKNQSRNSANWDILPLEMKREVIKHTDFHTRTSLRMCARQERGIVDSLAIHLPFVRITTKENMVSVIVCEGPNRVLRVDMTRKRVRFWTKSVVSISNNIEGNTPKIQNRSSDSIDEILMSLLGAITRKSVTIGTMNLDLQKGRPSIRDFLNSHYKPFHKYNNTKIKCSGLEFLNAHVSFLVVSEALVVNDCKRSDENEIKMFSGKEYTLTPHGYETFRTEFLNASILRCTLGALIAGILWKFNSQMEFYWIPGYQEAEPQRLCARFGGEIREYPHGMSIIKIPIHGKVLWVKMSKCGVLLRKCSTNEQFPPEPTEQRKCGLEWTCSNCDRSAESWYFRSTLGIEKQFAINK